IARDELKVLDHTEDSTRRFDASKDGPEVPKLAYVPPGPIALESLDPDHKYTLLLSASDKTVEGGVKHRSKAEIIQTDGQGNVSRRLVLCESELLETID